MLFKPQSSWLGLPKILSLATLLSVSLIVPPSLANQPEEGLPGRRVGGGSRGCGSTEQVSLNPKQFVALVPATNLIKTASASPTLLFHLPKLNTTREIEFVLRDAADQQVYETRFLVAAADSGILKLQPVPAELLQPGKLYHWYFSLICNPSDRAQDIVLEGWIQRIKPESALVQQLRTANSLQQVRLYHQSDLWQDALVILAQLRLEQPQDQEIAATWTAMLQDVGLESWSRAQLLAANVKQAAKPAHT